MEPKENSISGGIVALWGLLLLFQLLAWQLTSALAQTNALPGCPQRCGDVEIPYPFGIGPDCSKEGFTLSCTFSNGTYKPFLGDVEFLDISLSSGQARIADRVLSECYNAAKAGNVMYSESWTIDWAIRNKTCWEARRNKTSYACVSDNSVCLDSRDGPGYLCNCLEGYQGNPYLPHGCQDIDECTNKDKSACSGNCINKPGGFMCQCPLGGSKIMCTNEDFNQARPQKGRQNLSLPVKLAIGISASFVTLTLIALCAYIICERKGLRDVKEKYFQQHRLLWLLLDEIGKKQGLAFTIFTKKELERATNNFATSNILGYGGNGTVYKGVLKHDCVVAIKRAKNIGEKQMEEYGKEMIILAQINHKNVVKLLGCCLEVEVPMLVYEFVPNGNLFQLFHGKKPRDRVTFETRLGIAVECAEALAYLHSSASPPIIHGDVKSSNILLDDRLRAKVADFGASRPAPINEVQCVTLVQGTLGYLDPEYMETYELTHKSDVYSFGVVLLELLTGKKALSLEGPEEERSLSLNFLAATTENSLYQLLDDQIKDEEIELIKEVAALARTCLHIKREERPSMKEVAVELGRLKKLKQNQSEHHKPKEIEGLLDASSFDSDHDQGDSTSCYSLEQEVVMSIESRW